MNKLLNSIFKLLLYANISFSIFGVKLVRLKPIKCKGIYKQNSGDVTKEIPAIYLGKDKLELWESVEDQDTSKSLTICDLVPIPMQEKSRFDDIVKAFFFANSEFSIDKGTCVSAASYFLSRDKGCIYIQIILVFEINERLEYIIFICGRDI